MHILLTLARTRLTDLGHVRHSPNAFWRTLPTPFWSNAVAGFDSVTTIRQDGLKDFTARCR